MPFQIDSFQAYLDAQNQSRLSPELYWADIASHFQWQRPFTKVREGEMQDGSIRWFADGQINITENALDRHLLKRGEQIALQWEPNDPSAESKSYTYRELHQAVSQFGNTMRSMGIKKNERVILYMPMVPELAIAVLACARIGAVHSVVFAGFSAQALSDRIEDAQASMVITANEGRRGAKTIPLKTTVDEALRGNTSVRHVIVKRVTQKDSFMIRPRDAWWDDAVQKSGLSRECPAEIMDAEDMLFILYTSGSTGKPKGVVHTHGGYTVYAGYSFANVFQCKPGDVYWCSADIGWITGHTYIVYGPLLQGGTTLMFEGIPTFPDPGRYWEICEKYQVTQFYTAPTAIRALMAFGDEHVARHNLDSLKVLGTVGEPINEEAWHWYHEKIGQSKCPIVDTWWQTETGGIMISGLGDLSPQKPAHAGFPLPGIQPVLVNQKGHIIEENEKEGLLCIDSPWPSMIRTTYGDHERCLNTYFRPFPGRYFTGDGAKRDKQGMYRVIGRVDDVINVSGHRFGTAEIESAINQTPGVVESAVVGYEHEIKGQGIHAYVIFDRNLTEVESAEMTDAVKAQVVVGIGKIARPDRVQLVDGLPKTRSGKIMRRILRKIASGNFDSFGDTSTLLDPSIVKGIVAQAQKLI
ncbi:MAG: acetate--CoA ligase [Crocinitomicaceae bacterium]|nr:acetate--CoA ligase [Crocinitomicaceae bacterium]